MQLSVLGRRLPSSCARPLPARAWGTERPGREMAPTGEEVRASRLGEMLFFSDEPSALLGGTVWPL